MRPVNSGPLLDLGPERKATSDSPKQKAIDSKILSLEPLLFIELVSG